MIGDNANAPIGELGKANNAEEMAAFDTLPHVCREALNNAPYKLSVRDMVYAVRRYGERRALAMFNAFLSTGQMQR